MKAFLSIPENATVADLEALRAGVDANRGDWFDPDAVVGEIDTRIAFHDDTLKALRKAAK